MMAVPQLRSGSAVASGTGAVLVAAAGILRSLPARLGSRPAVAPKAPQPERSLAAPLRVSGSFLDTVCSLQLERSRNGPGKRAPARGGGVRRSRAAAGDVVRPGHTAPCGRCSIKRPGCVWCRCGWERGPSSRTKTGTALHSRGSTLGACGWRSASAPQHWRTAHALG
jgi:hypothetical protein